MVDILDWRFAMSRSLTGLLAVLALAIAGPALGQESKAAAATRKNLQQKVTLNLKEIGLKNFLEGDLNGELDKQLRFKIDNASGVSNNMKVSYAGKEVTAERVLNDLADKYDFGYYVVSNAANNKEDGKIVIRKSSKGKERGYEAGKEPKKDGADEQALREPLAAGVWLGLRLAPAGTVDRVMREPFASRR
jgi:hypothetical protein